MTRPSVLIHVQHLLGIGHLRRALLLGAGLARAGMAVHLASGGMPVRLAPEPGVTMHPLPGARAADQTFSTILTADGEPIDDAWRARRRDAALALFDGLAPDVLIVESFPFARRMFRFELLAVLDAATTRRPRPLVLCSIRDVLHADRKPARFEETCAIVEQYFDAVLVHGDPDLIPLAASFPRFGEIAAKVRYTGYMADDRQPTTSAATRSGVVVSAGGGAVGGRLLRVAAEARAYSALGESPWRLLAGDNLDDADFRSLSADAPDGVIVERARADFRDLLSTCRVSVSQAGYNTVMDLLQAATPMVLVPFAADGETEQPQRAATLADRGWARVVPEDALDARALAGAVDAAAAGGGPPRDAVDLTGMATTATAVTALLEARR